MAPASFSALLTFGLTRNAALAALMAVSVAGMGSFALATRRAIAGARKVAPGRSRKLNEIKGLHGLQDATLRNDPEGWCPSFDKTHPVGYTYRLLMGAAGALPAARKAPAARINGKQSEDPDRGGDRQDAEVGLHERGAAAASSASACSTLQKQLRENAGATTEHLRELSFAPDPADRATLEEEHALELRTRDRERKLLKKIDQALARIEDGSYGYCEETGEPIGIQRLLARPTATLTIEAQERREMKQKLYGE